MKTTAAANILNMLSLFAAFGLDPADVTTHDDALDALDLAEFWATATPGTIHHLPNGRSFLHW